MHKFSAASPQSSVLTVLRSVGPLGVLHEYACGALPSRALSGWRLLHFAQMKAAALRDENLCIILAGILFLFVG